jgi:hypothetical protein
LLLQKLFFTCKSDGESITYMQHATFFWDKMLSVSMGNPIPTFRGKIQLFSESKCPHMAVLDVLIVANEGATLLRNSRIRLPIYAESYSAAKAS